MEVDNIVKLYDRKELWGRGHYVLRGYGTIQQHCGRQGMMLVDWYDWMILWEIMYEMNSYYPKTLWRRKRGVDAWVLFNRCVWNSIWDTSLWSKCSLRERVWVLWGGLVWSDSSKWNKAQTYLSQRQWTSFGALCSGVGCPFASLRSHIRYLHVRRVVAAWIALCLRLRDHKGAFPKSNEKILSHRFTVDVLALAHSAFQSQVNSKFRIFFLHVHASLKSHRW